MEGWGWRVLGGELEVLESAGSSCPSPPTAQRVGKASVSLLCPEVQGS